MNRRILLSLCIFLLLMGTSCSNQDIIDENNINIENAGWAGADLSAGL